MAYFNHAFQKTILAIDGVIADGKKTWEVNETAAGEAKLAILGTDGENKDTTFSPTGAECFQLAGSTLREKDKLGKFMGGFQSLNTSKKINPKYVTRLYYSTPQEAKNAYALVGATESVSEGTTTVTLCDYAAVCGKTYYLQVNVKGNVVASTLMHNYFKRVPAYVSCCGVDDPTTEEREDSIPALKIYAEWAKYLANDPLTDGIIIPMIIADGVTYTKEIMTIDGVITKRFESDDETEETLEKAMKGDAETPAVEEGYLKILAAYEDTKFGNCTFQKGDGYELQPLEIYVSMVDKEGESCFNGVCTQVIPGLQATRTGESLLRELILDESYHQRFLDTDLRKREIEGGGKLLSMIDRTAQYPGIYLLHSVPRFNNPSGTFDNDQYLIQIICKTADLSTIVGKLETATGLTAETVD